MAGSKDASSSGCRRRILEGILITILGTVLASIIWFYIEENLVPRSDGTIALSLTPTSTSTAEQVASNTATTAEQLPSQTSPATRPSLDTPMPSDTATPSYTPTPIDNPTPTFTPTSTSTPTPVPTISTEGLVARYTLNGHATDTTGNGHDGLLLNVTATTDRDGNQNGALSFNGDNSAIIIPDDIDFRGGRGPVTVAAWFKTRRLSGDNPIVVKHKNEASKDWGMYLRNGVLLFATENGSSMHNDYYCRAASATIHLEEWTFAAFVASEPYLYVYVNGQLAGLCENFLNRWTSTDASIEIGQIGYREVNFLGAIDDVYIFNRALTQAEMITLSQQAPD